MGLNSTPSAERVHIGIFGKRNAGKSSIINAITDQSLAIVSDVKGTAQPDRPSGAAHLRRHRGEHGEHPRLPCHQPHL